MDKNELNKKTKDELIDIILEHEESIWNWMAIAQDIANAKSIVDKKYKRLIGVVGGGLAIFISTFIGITVMIIRGVLK